MAFKLLKSSEIETTKPTRGGGRGKSKFFTELDTEVAKMGANMALVIDIPQKFLESGEDGRKEFRQRLAQRVINIWRPARMKKEGVEDRFDLRLDYSVEYAVGRPDVIVVKTVRNTWTEEDQKRVDLAAKKRQKTRTANHAEERIMKRKRRPEEEEVEEELEEEVEEEDELDEDEDEFEVDEDDDDDDEF